MKKYFISALLCLFMVLEVSAQSALLSQSIILKKRKYTVRDLLEHVLPEAGVEVAYHDNIIPLGKVLRFTKKQSLSVAQVLQRICHNEPLQYQWLNGQLVMTYYHRPQQEYQHTLSGWVEDAASNDALVGATVYIRSLESGLATNGYGFYAFTLPRGTYQVMVSFVGYRTMVHEVSLHKDVQVNFQMKASEKHLDDVEVKDTETFDLKTENVLLSTNKLDIGMVRHVPYIGEIDLFQSSLLLPGISNVGEGVSGINVRGSASDRNLVMLDEAVIYNTNHFFGLVSVFNPDAVKDVQMLKGDFPAKYGGRNSSVMHIRQKEGNENAFHLSGGIGLVASRLMLEGPLLKKRLSYLISARTTFWDLIFRNLRDPTLANIRVNFQDFNAKMKWNINDKNKLYLSAYVGADANKFGIGVLKNWGNRLASIRWHSIYKNKHFVQLTSYFSQYEYRVIEQERAAGFVGISGIYDYALKLNVTSYASPKSLWEYGGEAILHYMKPGERIPSAGSGENAQKLADEVGIESAAYLSHEHRLGKFAISAGLRYSAFYNTGRKDAYVYAARQPLTVANITDTLKSARHEASKRYTNWLPRLALKYQWNERTSIKLGYFVTAQYMHLLSNTLSPASSDLWKISDTHVRPTVMRQSTLGVYHHIQQLDLALSCEVFYRNMDNVIDYKAGKSLRFHHAIETELLWGKARVYGVEIFMKKKFGKLTGWLGYTFSRSERKVDGIHLEEKINDGSFFLSNYDRTHDFAIMGIYQINLYWSLSSNFVYYTGRPYSFPSGKYEVDGILVPHFPDRNTHRLPDYHRLDIAATLKLKKKKKNGKVRKSNSSWVFSIYNVYSRRNTQAYFFRESQSQPGKPVVKKLSVLGMIVPSVTFNFEF